MGFQLFGIQFHKDIGYGFVLCHVEMHDANFDGCLLEIFYDGTWEVDFFFIKGFLQMMGKLW